MNEAITLVTIDDHPLIHRAIRSLVAERDDMILVGEGSSGDHIFPLVDRHRPDVLVLDLSMPLHEADGDNTASEPFRMLPVITRLGQAYPETAVIILSQHLSPGLVQGAIAGGVKGYLLKSDDLSLRLPEAIDLVSRGGVFFSDEVRQALLVKEVAADIPLLTPRQIEVLATIAQAPNASYTRHAAVLGIAESTLRNHLSQAFKALGVNNIMAAIMRCLQLGIIPADRERDQ